jgi:hypothetical protein
VSCGSGIQHKLTHVCQNCSADVETAECNSQPCPGTNIDKSHFLPKLNTRPPNQAISFYMDHLNEIFEELTDIIFTPADFGKLAEI